MLFLWQQRYLKFLLLDRAVFSSFFLFYFLLFPKYTRQKSPVGLSYPLEKILWGLVWASERRNSLSDSSFLCSALQLFMFLFEQWCTTALQCFDSDLEASSRDFWKEFILDCDRLCGCISKTPTHFICTANFDTGTSIVLILKLCRLRHYAPMIGHTANKEQRHGLIY